MADTGAARSTARTLERRRATPEGAARLGVVVAAGAALCFTRTDPVGALAGSALLGAVLFCDVARARMRSHRRGVPAPWLVAMLSQLREYVVYLGLAVGGALAGVPGSWGWAAGALVALALRDSLLSSRDREGALRVLAFPQPVRFLVIAVAATLWDPRAAFAAVITGCVLAVTAVLVHPAGSRR
ncbi:hypothetical protein [Nocardiopsis algeriensis]|uniref:Putative integral membrane protein n=1 Tax=Nocardiopsis algeriensis TaxID=1478215 RepID=A0A841IRM0_9ACTN|nr:hypothetical protein [Nocardiopsis algeriensis]MBB6118858.1 putative integral membrane protein [Nocardiopsis algeriensis]